MTAAYRVGLVLEGETDPDTVQRIARRVLVDEDRREHHWLEDNFDTTVAWVGDGPAATWLKWSQVRKRADELKVPPHRGHFREEPGLEDAHVAVLALRIFVKQDEPPSAVLLVRDSDDKPAARRKGLEQAREAHGEAGYPIVIGVAHAMAECWVLTGFRPQNADETQRCERERRYTRPWELTASDEHAPNSSKRVLRALTDNAVPRIQACIAALDLDAIRTRSDEAAERTGLADFVAEIRERLVPIVFGARSRDD